MNAVTQALRRPDRRIAELDPFTLEADERGVGYGCVDWYAYREQEPLVHAPVPEPRLRTETAGLPLVLTPEVPASAQRH
ncbi:MAG TPA: hypothetical protein VLV25_03950 [Steroidobacteraceae bacterium]|nr:hypothetical protein [Steroidobacteraceae bacterium]